MEALISRHGIKIISDDVKIQLVTRNFLNNHSTNRCYMEANKPCNSGFSLPFFPLADRRSHFL